jgi:hypothetical protein
MRHRSTSLAGLSLVTFATAAALLTSATPAKAAIETWVSGTGVDAGNVCGVTNPCRTFAYALARTNNGGTINVLTSGNYGPVTINKSVSIVADGVEALINTAANGAAIRVTANSNQAVSLRGLTIQGVTDNVGISYLSGAALHVQNCAIRRSEIGVAMQAPSSELYIADTLIADTGRGILIEPLGGTGFKAVLDRVRVENAGGDGMLFAGHMASSPSTATVRDSIVSGNAGVGIHVDGGSSGPTISAMVDRTLVTNNATGIRAGGPDVTIRIGDSTVSGNGTGVNNPAGGVIASYGTNKIDGNDTDLSGTLTPIDMK